jgi:hypothetical protein
MNAQAIEIVRDHLRELGIPPAQIAQTLSQWMVASCYAGDELVAATMTSGTEIHLVLAPEHRGKGTITRKQIRSVLGPMLEQYGYATSRAAKDSARDRLFLDRLGFYPTWSDDKFVYYMMTQLPFGKGD